MKLRNLVSRFTSILLIMLLVFSFVACGEKSSDEDDDDKEEKSKTEQSASNDNDKDDDADKDDDKETGKKDVTFSDIITEATSGDAGVITTDMVNEIIEDDLITYDELEDLFKQIPSCKAEAEAKLDFSMLAEANGETMDEELYATMEFVLEYDSDNMALHFGVSYDMSYSDESQKDSYDFWIINEDGTLYGYQKEGSDIAYRTTFGNLEEAFGEGIDLAEMKAEMESELSEYLDMYDEVFSAAEELTESDLIKALSDFMTVDENKDLYEIVMDFSASKIIDLALESDELAALLEEAGVDVDELESLLDMDIIEDFLTVKQLIDMINFDINYSIDVTDLFVTEIECDFSDCINDVADTFEDYLLESAPSEDAVVDIECKDAYIKYYFDNEANVSVEFDGEYEDLDESFDE